MSSVLMSWKRQPISVRVLRLFLGLTFIYAGWVKVSDPLFLPKGFVDSVTGFAATSPISSLLGAAAEHPTVFAWLIILSELAIGVFTLLGVATLPAAIGGFLLSVTLWLSSSWNVRPYFLAADPAYIVLWGVYALALPRSAKALLVQRREMNQALLGGAIVAALAVFGRFRLKDQEEQGENRQDDEQGDSNPTATKASSTGRTIATLSQVPVGGTRSFVSSQGDAIVIRMTETKVVAYTTRCTHEGCAVGYDSGRKTLACPCHGATFDPANNAAPTGPAPRPLTKINVAIQGTNIVEL